jgi:hypothetical protein
MNWTFSTIWVIFINNPGQVVNTFRGGLLLVQQVHSGGKCCQHPAGAVKSTDQSVKPC